MSVLRDVATFIAPKAVFRYLQYRDAARNYDAAGFGRRNKNRVIRDTGPNEITQTGLKTLIARHRDVTRNNPYAAKGIRAMVNNTVGTGIMPAITTSNDKHTQRLEDAWEEWAETTECDFDGDTTFYGLQALIMRECIDAGGCLVIRRRQKSMSVPFRLQVLAPDYLDTNRDQRQTSNGGWIIGGVEYNADGSKKGYWVYKADPGDFGNFNSRFIPADDVLHIFEKLRPGQVRGIPFGVSALMRIADFDEYEDAELMRQKIAACFAVFIENNNPTGIQGSGTIDPSDQREKVEPGMIERIGPGEKITFAAPPGTQNYDTYSKKILQGIAAGYGGLTYEAITGDLSNVNFSSARIGRIEMKQQVAMWQYNMLVTMLCSKVFAWFTEGLSMATGVSTKGIKVDWTPPKMEMIDPWKEANATNQMVRSGFKPWQEAVREQGWSVKAMIRQMKAAQKLWDENGLKPDSDGRKDGKAPEGNQGSGSTNSKN